MTTLVPPPPQYVRRGESIRWAVGTPEGPRSQVWTVKGHRNTDDVYLALRDRMDVVKLSFHRGTWRLANTAEAAAVLPDGQDRVLTRWSPTAEVRPGWRRAATVVVATVNLGPGYEDDPVSTGTIAWFPAPGPERALRFDLLFGDPDHGELTINNVAGEVGRITLKSGMRVWIVATEVQMPPEHLAGYARLRSLASEGLPAGDVARGWAWGHDNDDGGPTLIDLSGLGRAELGRRC